MMKYLENNSFDEEIKKDRILVDFYADWCGPCRSMGNVLETIQTIDILKVNVDKYPDIATTYGIMSIPTLLLFENGKLMKKNVGFLNKEELEKFIS